MFLLVFGLGARPASAEALAFEPVKVNLNFPATFVVTPGNRFFYGELVTGAIRRFIPESGADNLFFTVPDVVAETAEQGLLGLALHPDYPDVPYIYAAATRRVGLNRVLVNDVVRITNVNGQGSQMTLISRAAAGPGHNGGRILFGPDRMLYVIIGENNIKEKSQDLGVKPGKILRMTDTGAVPPDNPFPGSLVFAYGIRNGFGLDFDPETGLLWETENGPECNDELNLIEAGGNYGWGPSATCASGTPPTNTNQDGPDPILPKQFYPENVAPTGVVFCSGCRLGEDTEGRLFYGRLNTNELQKVTLDAERRNVIAETTVLTLREVVLSMEAGPDGTIYFSTGGAIYELTTK